MQGSIYPSSASTSTSSAENTKKQVIMKLNDKVEISTPYLTSPSGKKTNILWTLDENSQSSIRDHPSDQEESYHSKLISSSSFDSYTITDQQDDYEKFNRVKKEKTRKRRSNGSPIAPLLSPPPNILSSTPMTRNNSPLPPLPTVENFLTIMNSPISPDSSYFSARSTSSSSSSQSTLNSMSLDDVTDSLAKTQISSTDTKFLQNANSNEKHQEYPMEIDTCPPTPPPKDPLSAAAERLDFQRKLMDPQNHVISNMNNKQEKRSSTISLKRSSAISSTDMRISTSDISNHTKFTPSPPNSADANINKKRPPIPPRTSSMPLPPTLPKHAAPPPPLPADAKKKTNAYSRRSSAKALEENNTWSTLLENTSHKKDELMKRAKLGRSLGTATSPSKKLKKLDSGGKILKVTENGSVVLLFEMIDGRLQAIAGTSQKLFEKLADETVQDKEYIDTYLMNHGHFISSLDLLNLLINRFHLEPSPGEQEYFKKWQFSIQTK